MFLSVLAVELAGWINATSRRTPEYPTVHLIGAAQRFAALRVGGIRTTFHAYHFTFLRVLVAHLVWPHAASRVSPVSAAVALGGLGRDATLVQAIFVVFARPIAAENGGISDTHHNNAYCARGTVV